MVLNPIAARPSCSRAQEQVKRGWANPVSVATRAAVAATKDYAQVSA